MAASSVVVSTGRDADDRGGDTSGETFVAVLLQDPGQLFDRVSVDDIRRGPRLRAIHAHVEGSLVPIRETAIGFVELRRTDTEIEQGSREAVY